MKQLTAILGLAVLLHAAPATAQTGAERLTEFLRTVTTLQAEFSQTVADQDGIILQEAAGTLVVHRPGKFRWDYTAPAAQVVVGDGDRVWMYDAELAQVTVRPMDTTLASTPAMLLSGDGVLDEDIRLAELGEVNGIVWVGVMPELDDTEFESARIGFRGTLPAVIELIDPFGQRTRIEFEAIRVDEPVDETLFRFDPPPGVDVIGADG